MNSKTLILLTLLGVLFMPKPIHTKAVTEFDDAVEVCHALHGADQPFTIKLLYRSPQTAEVTRASYKHGTIAEHAVMFNRWRSDNVEPFVMVGQTTGAGLGGENVHGTWALAVDLDHDTDIDEWADSLVKPTIAVETSNRRYHLCWILTEPMNNVEARRFLVAMTHRLGGDPCFAHSAQAVRLPGFVNQKYGTTATLAIAPSDSRIYSDVKVALGLDVELVTACIRSSLPPLDRNLILPRSIPQDVLLADLSAALKYVESDDYALWVKVTAALHSVGEEAYDLWDEWSRSSTKYDEKIMRKKWESFGKVSSGSSASVASIFFLAQRAGWRNPGYRCETKSFNAESLTDRTVGRMIAEKMALDFASKRVGSGEKEGYQLLEWDGLKYRVLDNPERRARIEQYLKDLVAEIGAAT